MSEREHKTRKGELLGRLEHRCERSGLWIVEGHMVYRGPRYWRVKTLAGDRVSAHDGNMTTSVWVTFTEALEVVADRVSRA
jgi:hypothetical protein